PITINTSGLCHRSLELATMIPRRPGCKSTGYGAFWGAFGLFGGAAAGRRRTRGSAAHGGGRRKGALPGPGLGRGAGLAGARRRPADRADEVALRIVRMRNEMAAALPARRQLQHA